MSKGFTLVELSIVLVIVGLLIGGILISQSLISTAKIQAQVKQIQQFDIAVQNFMTVYGGLPGDSSKAHAQLQYWADDLGNDNGILNGGSWTSADEPCNPYKYHECSLFFRTLKEFNFLPIETFKVLIDKTHGLQPDDLYPASPFKNYPVLVNSSPTGKLYYEITIPPGGNAQNDSVNAGPYTGAEALAIDKKTDDGIPTTGSIAAPWHQISWGETHTDTDYSMNITSAVNWDWCLKANSSTYNTAPDTTCGLIFRSNVTP